MFHRKHNFLLIFATLSASISVSVACNQAHAQWFYPSGYYGKGATVYGDYLRGYASLLHARGAYNYGTGAYWNGYSNYAYGPNRGSEYSSESSPRVNVVNHTNPASQQNQRKMKAQMKRLQSQIANLKKQLSKKNTLSQPTQRLPKPSGSQPTRAQLVSRFRDHVATRDVLSGDSMNFLLSELGINAIRELPAELASQSIDCHGVKLTTATGLAHRDIDLLLTDSFLIRWPRHFAKPAYTEIRVRIDRRIRHVCRAVWNGERIPAFWISMLRDDVDSVRRLTTLECHNLSLRDELGKFLNQVDVLLATLKSNQAIALFDGTLIPQAKNVGELLNHIVVNGIEI